MKREQAIDMIKQICNHNIPYYAYGNNEAGCDMAGRLQQIIQLADILKSIPIDVPYDIEIEDKATLYATEEGGEDLEQMLQQPDLIAFYDGAIWMRNEIIKRNS